MTVAFAVIAKHFCDRKSTTVRKIVKLKIMTVSDDKILLLPLLKQLLPIVLALRRLESIARQVENCEQRLCEKSNIDEGN